MSYIIYNGFYDLYAIIKTNERNNLIKVSSKAMFEPQTNQKLSSYTKIQIFYSRISWFTDLRAKYVNFWVKSGDFWLVCGSNMALDDTFMRLFRFG